MSLAGSNRSTTSGGNHPSNEAPNQREGMFRHYHTWYRAQGFEEKRKGRHKSEIQQQGDEGGAYAGDAAVANLRRSSACPKTFL